MRNKKSVHKSVTYDAFALAWKNTVQEFVLIELLKEYSIVKYIDLITNFALCSVCHRDLYYFECLPPPCPFIILFLTFFVCNCTSSSCNLFGWFGSETNILALFF